MNSPGRAIRRAASIAVIGECDIDLATELRRHPDLVAELGSERIDELCDPANYLGSARIMTSGVVNA